MTNAKVQMSNEIQSSKLEIWILEFDIDLAFGF
jgi:hypothetical protein